MLRDHHLLVVSDLHLSEGRNPRTGRFSPTEDFLFDEQFSRFLAHHRDARRGSRPWHLVINGDFVDFLQVVTRRGAAPAMRRDPGRPYYGLACGEQESAHKLVQVARGHPVFMRALAAFVAAGNAVTIVKGNHDVEFHYPSVRQAFLGELQRAWESERSPATAPGGFVDQDRVRFADWFYCERDLIWIEHGHQYEGLNSFRTWLSPLLPEIPGWPPSRRDEIDLPLGSFFVRYLFNRVETVEPFADNMKPATRFIGWILAKHPVTALRFLARDGSYMLAKIRRALRRLGPSAWAGRDERHAERLAELEVEWGLPPGKLRAIDALRASAFLQEPARWVRAVRPLLAPWFALPFLLGLLVLATATALLAGARLLWCALPSVLVRAAPTALAAVVLEVGPWTVLAAAVLALFLLVRWALTGERRARAGTLAGRAREIAKILPVQHVVMGHTHDADLRRLGTRAGRAIEYFNTGSWTKVFGEERDRLLGEDVRFTFLEAERRGSGLRVRLMEWNDEAGETRLLRLFQE